MWRSLFVVLLFVGSAKADLLSEARAGFPMEDVRTHSLSISVGNAIYSQSGFTLKDDDLTSLYCSGAGSKLCANLTNNTADTVVFTFDDVIREMPESDFFWDSGVHNVLSTTQIAPSLNGIDFGGYKLDKFTFGFECFLVNPLCSTYVYSIYGTNAPEPASWMLTVLGGAIFFPVRFGR